MQIRGGGGTPDSHYYTNRSKAALPGTLSTESQYQNHIKHLLGPTPIVCLLSVGPFGAEVYTMVMLCILMDR